MNVAEREFFEEKLQEIKELEADKKFLSKERDEVAYENGVLEDKIEELKATVVTQCETNQALTGRLMLAEADKRLLSTENKRLREVLWQVSDMRDTLSSIAKFALKKEYDNDEG